jgi:hypothetical protein
MVTLVKQSYPATDTQAITCTIASLASDSNLRAGRSAAVVSNTTNVDIDALVTGRIKLGTTPTTAKRVEVWAYSATSVISGTPSYPDTLGGADANVTLTSDNTKFSALKLLWGTDTDATTGAVYDIPKTSIRELFGEMPAAWCLFVVHSTVAALDSTGGNHFLHYERIQKQLV